MAITTSSNTTIPVGMVQDYNNTNASRAVHTYRVETSGNPLTHTPEHLAQNSFAQAIYGDGPYSLDHPNALSEILAQNIDFIA